MNEMQRRNGSTDLMDTWLGWPTTLDWAFGPVSGRQATTRSTPVDIIDTPEFVEIKADLPGFDLSEVDVSVDKGILTMSAKKTMSSEKKAGTFCRRERSETNISRSFDVDSPDLDTKGVKAQLRNGILTVTIPKTKQQEIAAPKKISIEA